MSTNSSSFPYGYALRRDGSCSGGEVDCGPTWGDNRVCCPGSTSCPRSSETSVCCPSSEDCTDSLLGNPHCGDDTADLYVESQKSYFCCASNATAFEVSGKGWVGCADDLSDVNTKVKTATMVSSASASTAFTSISATTTTSASGSLTTTFLSTSSSPTAATASPTATNDSSGESSSHTNKGAIAGGVVGGVAGAAILIALVWLFLRRYKKNILAQYQETQSNSLVSPQANDTTSASSNPRSVGQLQELSATRDPIVGEMSSHGSTRYY